MTTIAIATFLSADRPRSEQIEGILSRSRALVRLFRRSGARRAALRRARAEIRDERGLLDAGLDPATPDRFAQFMATFLAHQL